MWVLKYSPAKPGEYNGAGAIERAHKDWLDGKLKETGIMMYDPLISSRVLVI